MLSASPTSSQTNAVRAGEASSTSQEIVYRRMVLGPGKYIFMVMNE